MQETIYQLPTSTGGITKMSVTITILHLRPNTLRQNRDIISITPTKLTQELLNSATR